MSVTIESVTISTVTEKRLVLSNAQWAATLSIGTDWNIIRVGARVCVDDFGAALTGTPLMYLGFASSPSAGFANGPLSGAGTGHYVGFISNATSWGYGAGPPPYYNCATTGGGKKVGSTTTAGTGTTWAEWWSGAPASNRLVKLVEIEKGTPWTIRWSCNNATITDTSEDFLLACMDIADFGAATSLIVGASVASVTVSVDEGVDGYINAICAAWDRSAVTCHISEMFYGKYA